MWRLRRNSGDRRLRTLETGERQPTDRRLCLLPSHSSFLAYAFHWARPTRARARHVITPDDLVGTLSKKKFIGYSNKNMLHIEGKIYFCLFICHLSAHSGTLFVTNYFVLISFEVYTWLMACCIECDFVVLVEFFAMWSRFQEHFLLIGIINVFGNHKIFNFFTFRLQCKVSLRR